MPQNIPDYVTKYLWDVPIDSITPTLHANFIIERVLEYGDFDSINWIKATFEKKTIIEVLKQSKKLSPKTGYLYSLYFGVPKEQILCIRKPFTQKQNRF